MSATSAQAKNAAMAAMVSRLKTSVQALRDSLDVHVSGDAKALRACMSKNGLGKEAAAWDKAVTSCLASLRAVSAKLDGPKVPDNAMVMIVNAISEVSRAMGEYYGIMSKKNVIDVMGRSCFSSFGPFIRLTFVAGAEAMKKAGKVMHRPVPAR